MVNLAWRDEFVWNATMHKQNNRKEENSNKDKRTNCPAGYFKNK